MNRKSRQALDLLADLATGENIEGSLMTLEQLLALHGPSLAPAVLQAILALPPLSNHLWNFVTGEELDARLEVTELQRLATQSLEARQRAAGGNLELAEAQQEVRRQQFEKWRESPAEAPLEALLLGLEDTDLDINLATIRALTLRLEPTVLPGLLAQVHSPRVEVREETARALGLRGDLQASAALCALLEDPADTVVALAAEALGKLADPTATPALIKVVLSPSQAYPRRPALEALRRIGPPALPNLQATVGASSEHPPLQRLRAELEALPRPDGLEPHSENAQRSRTTAAGLASPGSASDAPWAPGAERAHITPPATSSSAQPLEVPSILEWPVLRGEEGAGLALQEFCARAPESRTLCLVDSHPSPRDLQALGGLRELRALGCIRTPLPSEGLVHLARLPHLNTLWLDGTGVGAQGMAAFAETPLKSFTYVGPLSQELIRFLGQQQKLNLLTLCGSGLIPTSVAHLANLQALRMLSLRGTAIDDDGLKCLGRLELCQLDLYGSSNLTGSGLPGLHLASLEALRLEDCPIRDEALMFLRGHPRLRELDLRGTCVTKKVVELAPLPGLSLLDLRGAAVESDAYAEVRRAFPGCTAYLEDETSDYLF